MPNDEKLKQAVEWARRNSSHPHSNPTSTSSVGLLLIGLFLLLAIWWWWANNYQQRNMNNSPFSDLERGARNTTTRLIIRPDGTIAAN